MNIPRRIQTYLPDGTLEGVRLVELSESSVKAFVIPRIKLNDIKNRSELKQPALYLLISSGDNQLYIGESENFYDRIKNHDQAKDFWDLAVAIVSSTNSLEKSDVKYLESLAVEKAKATAAMQVLNKTVPVRNNIHEFKVHSLEIILEDVSMIAELLGYSIFTKKNVEDSETWYCITKKTKAKAQFRGDKFIVLEGSVIDKSYSPGWASAFPKSAAERSDLLTRHGKASEDTVVITENIPFKSPNHAGGFVTGRNVNAWITWKNSDAKSMDEVMRRGGKL
jgi:hypothetical protein